MTPETCVRVPTILKPVIHAKLHFYSAFLRRKPVCPGRDEDVSVFRDFIFHYQMSKSTLEKDV